MNLITRFFEYQKGIVQKTAFLSELKAKYDINNKEENHENS